MEGMHSLGNHAHHTPAPPHHMPAQHGPPQENVRFARGPAPAPADHPQHPPPKPHHPPPPYQPQPWHEGAGVPQRPWADTEHASEQPLELVLAEQLQRAREEVKEHQRANTAIQANVKELLAQVKKRDETIQHLFALVSERDFTIAMLKQSHSNSPAPVPTAQVSPSSRALSLCSVCARPLSLSLACSLENSSTT